MNYLDLQSETGRREFQLGWVNMMRAWYGAYRRSIYLYVLRTMYVYAFPFSRSYYIGFRAALLPSLLPVYRDL